MRIVFLLSLFILSAVTVLAQTGWPLLEYCMGELQYPIVPKGNWDFSGLIISSVYPDGVRAIRADQNLDYYIALESENAFPAAGAISPDGRYFAYPLGHVQHYATASSEDMYVANSLRVVRTDGTTDETYLFEVNNYALSGVGRSFNLGGTIWFSSELLYYPDKNIINKGLINFPSGESIDWTQSVRLDDLHFVSPDGSRAFTETLYDLENGISLAYPSPYQVFWFPDSSAFIASAGGQLSILSRDGDFLDTIDIEHKGFIDIAIAPNSQMFALWTEEQDLLIGDINVQVLYSLCFQGLSLEPNSFNPASYSYNNLAWSPDSGALAFSYDNYLVILDIQTFESQILDHYSRQVMAWVSLEGETVNQAEIQIREP